MTAAESYEKLGMFYLGRTLRPDGETDGDYLYDAADLTTHAVIVGMTGSGKTGLGVTLVEEAAIDGIPVIAIDPKGDLGNLLLTFPKLQPADFKPWVEPSIAATAGQSVDDYAASMADRWRSGLEDWGQPPERIAKFASSVERTIYTPGSNSGLPITVLKSFAAPTQAVLDDAETFRERVAASASGLLSLAGIQSDPLTGREHVLIATILETAWRAGENLSVGDLIRRVQSPPFDKVGVFALETFFPSSDRTAMAMRLNALLASPSFAGWLEGEPLDVQRLLYTKEGRPRLSILSIAHLTESERMFFVTLLLGEVLSWVRAQPGTNTLRAILYMDEIAGYFPPVAEPPSKRPMLTLLKQARAYGLGVVLATQNPVDLDYKGLSNTGTWFLGRLQTERDKARVLEGLEGASATAGQSFDRKEIEATLAGLAGRTFLVNNVHEDAPVVIHNRWALSYLRGPLTRDHIAALMQDRKAAAASKAAAQAGSQPVAAAPPAGSHRPHLPPGVDERVLPVANDTGSSVVYRPALLGRIKLHFVKSGSSGVDCWQERSLLLPGELAEEGQWDDAERVESRLARAATGEEPSGPFAEVPAAMLDPKQYARWEKSLKSAAYRTQRLSLWSCKDLKATSEPTETEGDFRVRLSQRAREAREEEVGKLRKKYASKVASIKKRIVTAQQRVEREQGQASRAWYDSMVSIGSTLFGALFGRKTFSVTNLGRAATAARGLGRATEQRSDVGRASEKLEDLQQELEAMNAELAREVEQIAAEYDTQTIDLEEIEVTPRKSDIQTAPIALVWCPWSLDTAGFSQPAWERVE